MEGLEMQRLRATTAAIVRAFNNAHVAKTVRNLIDMGVARVVVVTDATRDRGATRGWLSRLPAERVHLIEMSEGYSWSNALNAGVASIRQENFLRRLQERDEIEFVLNVSVECLLKRAHLDAMLERIASSKRVGAVGTSFRGLKNGNEVSLGESYRHPRNTGMLLRLAVFAEVGHFDAWTDSVGGMEDLAFLIFMSLASSFGWEMLDLKVDLVVGVNYDQKTKEERERKAMEIIIANFRRLLVEGIGAHDRLDTLLEKMGLKS